MFWEENNNQKIKKLESQDKSIYSLDTAIFYPILEPEIWDFSEALEFKKEFILFFLMRAILHKKKTQEGIELIGLSIEAKAQIQKLGLSSWMNKFFTRNFFPSLVGSSLEISFKFLEIFEKDYFYINYIQNKKNFTISGGGILVHPNVRLKEPIEELFQKLELSKREGIFYYRTTHNSYLYPLEKDSKSRIFFVQEREKFEFPFHFFYIDCKD